MTAPCGFVCSWARFVGLASTLVASHNDIPWLLRRGFQPKRETTRSFVQSLSLLRTKGPSDFRSEIVLHWSVWESHRGLPRENDASRKWHAPDQHKSYPNVSTSRLQGVDVGMRSRESGAIKLTADRRACLLWHS